MIKISEIKEIPEDLVFYGYTAQELEISPEELRQLEAASSVIWLVEEEYSDAEIYPVCLAGVFSTTTLGVPQFWFCDCCNFADDKWSVRMVKAVSKLLHQRYSYITTLVREDWPMARKFARFCGFKETSTKIEHAGQTLIVFEAKNRWA